LTSRDEFGKVLNDANFQKFVDGLGHSATLTGLEVGRAAEAAATVRELAHSATDLAKSAESAKMFDVAKSATDLAKAAEQARVAAARGPAKGAEARARLTEAGRAVDGARSVDGARTVELAKMVENGSLSRDAEFNKAVVAAGLDKSVTFMSMMKSVDFQRM